MSDSTPSFLDPAVAHDPYAFYAHLRHEAPVGPVGLMDLWGVARYDEVVRVLRDPDTFSSVVGLRRLAGGRQRARVSSC